MKITLKKMGLLIVTILSIAVFSDSVYADSFSCSYVGQMSGSTLTITKKDSLTWEITYPNNNTKTMSSREIPLGTVMPTSNCDDIFFETNHHIIKAVEANTDSTNSIISGYCRKSGENYEQYCSGSCKVANPSCGNSNTDDNGDDEYGCPAVLKPAITFLKRVVFNTVQIFVPILLILMGTIDLVKAMMSGDDKSSKDSVSKFVKRILSAVFVFFITTIVSIVIGMIAKTDVGNKDDWKNCWLNIE